MTEKKRIGIGKKTYILVNENVVNFFTEDEYINHVESCRAEELSPEHFSKTLDYHKCSKAEITTLATANKQFKDWMMGADYQDRFILDFKKKEVVGMVNGYSPLKSGKYETFKKTLIYSMKDIKKLASELELFNPTGKEMCFDTESATKFFKLNFVER